MAMNDRRIAEQALANFLYKRGVIGEEDNIIVRRLDMDAPFSIMLGDNEKEASIIGKCNYFPRENRFKEVRLFKRNRPRPGRWNKKETTMMDFLRHEGKVNIMG